jgi:hypothetical protein
MLDLLYPILGIFLVLQHTQDFIHRVGHGHQQVHRILIQRVHRILIQQVHQLQEQLILGSLLELKHILELMQQVLNLERSNITLDIMRELFQAEQ